ncbi:hypothetical protein [Pleomorphovibrio marinus]|uniref:hypothetical protein n=1 Tax=Pleomorphovibrio marinus TaxID=2164132 RepID=UPI000E0BEBD1|nr:hypothetical protein [Pleomorphovibrio marinus]
MNIETRKIKFVQEFLKLQDERSISKLESLLHREKNEADKINLSPYSKDGLNNRIDKSEKDFQIGEFKTSQQLIAKFQSLDK